MIFMETDRVVLRTLEKGDLPRLVQLLDVWDLVRWLSVMPYPYTIKNAQDLFSELQASYASGEPQFYSLANKDDNQLIGGIALHPPRGDKYEEGEIEIGYWLGKEYWGRGLMPEAARAVLSIGFGRRSTNAIVATTEPNNYASQKVLLKIGMHDMGLASRDYRALRGSDDIIRWRLTREEWQTLVNEGHGA